jgi:hypothetical protein
MATYSVDAYLAALTPKFAWVNATASGDTDVVALVSSKKIRVLSAYMVTGGTATTVYFKTKATGTHLTADFANAANGGAVLPFAPVGWFETLSGEALTATLGAGSTTGIGVVYVEV